MINNIQKEHKYIINLLKNICINMNTKLYIVGGAVRDNLVNIPSKDIDICSETDILPILEKLKNYDNEITYKFHEQFQTSTISYKNISIDLIRCRSEIYEYYGALPKISPSNLYDDLKRRDFTINAIAYDIIENTYVDYFNGVEDLKNKIIKKIHEDSYSKDATRILRAIKYANRLNFSIYDDNEIESAIKSGIMNSISCDRFIREVSLMLEENNWIKNLQDLNDFQIIEIEKDILMKKLYFMEGEGFEERLLKIFLAIKEDSVKEILINNSIIDKSIKKSLKKYFNQKQFIYNNLENNTTNFKIYEALRQFDETVLNLLSADERLFFKIYNYKINLKKLYDTTIIKKGKHIEKNNTKAKDGKNIGALLKEYNKLRLNLLSEIEYDDFIKLEGSLECH